MRSDDVFNYQPEELAEMTPAEAMLSQVRDGEWLDRTVFPELQWAVNGLIPEGFGLITGPPKLGKSWFVLDVLLAIAAGGRAVGRIPVEQRPVLYLALEDGDRRMQSRVRILNGDEPTPTAFQFVTRLEGDIFDLVDVWLQLNPKGVIALDTLGKVMPPAFAGENAYSRDYRVGGKLKMRTDAYPGSTLMVVHHVRKQGSGDWMDSTSGTNGLNGSADWTLNLDRARGEGEAIIRVTGRDVGEGEYAATLSQGQWTLAGTDLDESSQIARMTTKQTGLGDDAATIVEYIDEHPEGVRTKDVAERMDWDDRKARTYLNRLVESRRVERYSRGLYTPVSSVSCVSLEQPHSTHNPTNDTPVSLPVSFAQGSDQEEQTNDTLNTHDTQEVGA